MARYVGIDVGGSSVKIGVFDEKGNLLERRKVPTDTSKQGANILPDTAGALTDLDDLLGVGIGVPGPVVSEEVFGAVNLGWGRFNVKETFLGELGREVPIAIENDAGMAAYGEYRQFGGVKGPFVFITVGTGIGGGIVLDGELYRGFHGAAGEFGHMNILPDGPKCACGNRGCLEAVAGANAMKRRLKRKLRKQRSSPLRQGPITIKRMFDAARAGDPGALETIDETATALGRALSMVAGTLDPAVFVFGGGVSEAGEFFLSRIRQAYEAVAFTQTADVAFEPAKLGNDAGIYGAMEAVRHAG